MYKNQYFISSRILNNANDLLCTSFNQLNVYHHPSLNISISNKDSTEILLAGYIINPFRPLDSNDDIAKFLAETCHSKESLFKEIQSLSGRYVLLYKNGTEFIALNDSCALRQLYYGFIDKDIVLTASPRMFLNLYGGSLQESPEKQAFTNLKEFNANDHEWYGDKCIDDRLMKVLPNHYLDIRNRKICRIPIFFDRLVAEKDIVEYMSALLKGNMAAITKRYQVIQPLTAGWDSRTLLAASKEYLKDIQFFVIDFSSGDKPLPDVWVPRRISEKLGLNLQVIKLKEPTAAFLSIFKKEHIIPRFTYLAEAEYFYDNYANSNTVRVNGIAGATLKAIYGYARFKVPTNQLHHFTYYLGKSEFIKKEIGSWVNDAQGYAKEYGIPLLDLFHWEQKVGNWGASCVFEQDIAIENFSPHANRNLYVSVLRIKPQKRAKPECLLISDVVKNLWQETLSEPINPAGFTKKIKRKLHRNSILKNYQLRIKSALNRQ
jgi:hypothetical protein